MIVVKLNFESESRENVVEDRLSCVLALVRDRRRLLRVGSKNPNGRIVFDAVSVAQSCVRVGVHHTELGYILERVGDLDPLGREHLALAAPQHIELDIPEAIACQHSSIEVGSG